MNHFLLIFIMVIVGAILALQGPVNASLGKLLHHPLHAAIVSFALGLVVLCIVSIFMKLGLPSFKQLSAVPRFSLIGGFLGAICVSTVIICIPKIGVANAVLASLCGQVIFSLVLDHFGILGMPKISIDFTRVFGALLIIGGLFVLNYRRLFS